MNSSQRNYLRKQAHHLKPVIMIGQNGLSEPLLKAAAEALESHELIKLKFQDFKEEKRDLANVMADKLGSEIVGIIGNVLTMYKPATDPDKRSIKLPE